MVPSPGQHPLHDGGGGGRGRVLGDRGGEVGVARPARRHYQHRVDTRLIRINLVQRPKCCKVTSEKKWIDKI